ncbi:hypothetical protein BRARA_E02458 [Brassica rapa]|uniref:HAT C-terminal dimerisation domain-containing protein n=1 Tax=Brassica campestris TaxID=3711 RepID=A0A397ZDB7_BRACM|nr:hypothetical protein BRARA_E02458 [Brassica rapa]
MDNNSDLDSSSGSDSETMKEPNIDVPVEDTVDDLMDDFEDDDDDDDFEEEEEDGDDDDMVEDEADGVNNPISNWLGITPASIRKEVLKIHEERKLKAKRFLNDFQGKLTLSYEWLLLNNQGYYRGPIKHEDFTCLAAHFIDDNWKVRKWILGYTTDASVPLDDVYTHHFRTAVQSFDIQNKVSTILLPNDEDFDEKTVDAIKKCVGEGGVNPPVFVVYCCADLFRLVVDGLCSGFRWTLYEELRMLVGWGRCSSPNWDLKLYHYQRAVDMHKEDAFSKDEIYDDYDKPSDEEWVKIETFCKLGGCVYKVAKELFEEGWTTSNVYFHLLAELKVMLKMEVDGGGGGGGGSEYFLRKAKKVLKMFDKYWSGMFLVLAAACVLDPRFKMKYVEFYCSKKIEDDEGSNAEAVLDYLRSLFARYAASDICKKPICSVDTVDHEVDEEDEDEDYGADEEETDKEEKEKPDAYKDFVLFQEFLKFEGSSSRELGESELDAYLKEPIMEWNKDFKALEWWKEESQKYPVLSRVARDILSIPISRATSYDSYVTDKREPPENVLSMDAKAANAVMCGRSWLPLIR